VNTLAMVPTDSTPALYESYINALERCYRVDEVNC